MSVPLQYATKCAKCGGFMSPGTPVDFVKDGSSYTHWHAEGFDDSGEPMDGCLVAAAQQKRPKTRPQFEIRVCADPTCYAGHPGWAFRQGDARAGARNCHLCGKPWLTSDAYLERAA